MAYLTNKDYLLEVAKGKITGHTLVRRNGLNPDVDTAGEEDVWAVGGTVTWRTTQATASIVSTSTDDVASTGTGARSIKIYGLSDAWAEINETISMNGTTPVASSTSFLIIDRAEILTTGTGEVNAGDITVSISSVDHAKILAGYGEGQASIYQVPAGKTAYLIGWSSSLYKATSGSVELRLMTAEDGVGWRVRSVMELTQTGSGVSRQDNQEMILALPAKTRVKVRAKTSVDNMGIITSFSLVVL